MLEFLANWWWGFLGASTFFMCLVAYFHVKKLNSAREFIKKEWDSSPFFGDALAKSMGHSRLGIFSHFKIIAICSILASLCGTVGAVGAIAALIQLVKS